LILHHAKDGTSVIVVRTVVNPDPAVRRNLVDALTGAGAPAGVQSCVERDDVVSVAFDDELTHAELIDDLITIESHFVPAAVPPLDDQQAARLAAVGLGDPDLDSDRILERHLAGLE
jgi:hypothetical protein